jgi:hypothetical protein
MQAMQAVGFLRNGPTRGTRPKPPSKFVEILSITRYNRRFNVLILLWLYKSVIGTPLTHSSSRCLNSRVYHTITIYQASCAIEMDSRERKELAIVLSSACRLVGRAWDPTPARGRRRRAAMHQGTAASSSPDPRHPDLSVKSQVT